LNKQHLIDFEDMIAEVFNAGEIPYPVHFSNGNEERLIKIFDDIGADDYVYGSWRMHYHALLKGVPPVALKHAIMSGHSMALKFPEYRVYGSAIVGGIVPIALGTAMSIAAREGSEMVFCFVGDMTSLTGIFSECLRYAEGWDLPIRFIIEDNNASVCTDTRDAWQCEELPDSPLIIHYQYESKYPHCGSGIRVQF